MNQFLFLYRRPHEQPALSPAQMQQTIPNGRFGSKSSARMAT